jgi:hypothetical protein
LSYRLNKKIVFKKYFLNPKKRKLFNIKQNLIFRKVMQLEEAIQFIANMKGWIAVKKLKVTEKTDPKTVMEFLASLGTGIDRKVEENLEKIVELNKLNAALDEILNETGKSTEKIISEVNGRKINSIINELVLKDEWQKGEQKEISEFLKVYAMRKALKKAKIRVDYSEIEVPGIKKLKKTKV